MHCIVKDGKWLASKESNDGSNSWYWAANMEEAEQFLNYSRAERCLEKMHGEFWQNARIIAFKKPLPISKIIISNNKISRCEGSGVKYRGDQKADIVDNFITYSKTGVDVDESFTGIIDNNTIQYVKDGIVVNKINPYDYFNIPLSIEKKELYDFFEKLDANNSQKHPEIVADSNLAKIDQFTSIAERIHNFVKEYGPILITTFGPYLNNSNM